MDAQESAPARVSFTAALRFWLQLGFISFGGPAGQIALMHEELVERRRWIDEAHFLHALNFCMLLPGPEAQQLATYLGWRLHGVRGGIAAGVMFILPSLLLMMGLAWAYLAHGGNAYVAGALGAIKPAVVAIVVLAAWRIGRRTLVNGLLVALAVAGCVARLAGAPFPLLVAVAALIGLAWPSAMLIGGGAAPTDVHAATTRNARARALRIGGIALALWATTLGALWAAGGWTHTYTQMGWFFTKAALLTFGGAYAVLPYVFDGAVTGQGWLDATQMIDGLALGETTPGPLIMIVAFVGYLGGWQQQVLGADSLALAGVCGAVVATWFTFLPSFLFILGGAPLVEATRGVARYAAPLAAISAVVVGAILQLGIFLGEHVLIVEGRVAVPAAAIALTALLALTRGRRSIIEVVLAAAALGCVGALLR